MPDDRVIVLFDGVCALCNRVVRFARKRMKPDRLRFAPLQSPEGQALLRRHGIDSDQSDSVVVVADDRACVRSDAALRLMRELRFPWPVLSILRIIPRGWRDAIYRWIARKRFDWFGKTDACPLPDESGSEPARTDCST